MSPFRIVSLVLALNLAGCLGPSAISNRFEAVSRPLAPDAGPRPLLGEAEVLGIMELNSSDQRFGGLSGLAFDGHTMTAISDVGRWVSFRLDMDPQGRPLAVGDLQIGDLGGVDGSKEDSDAEELTRLPQGWLVSFERHHRLMLYPNGLSDQPQILAAPEGYGKQPENGGVEAVTVLNDGRLLLLSEEGVDADGWGWAWIGQPGAWSRLSYHREGLFHPTSAATLPNGDVLVTERRFTLLGGVALRLVRLTAQSIQAGAQLNGHELFQLTPPRLVDNYEGVALRSRDDGRMVAYIISDDNFSPLQATLLMAVLLPR